MVTDWLPSESTLVEEVPPIPTRKGPVVFPEWGES
jgi:hypothetical protein